MTVLNENPASGAVNLRSRALNNEQQRIFSRRQRGQSLTEVALVLPIILLIIAGLVEISNLIVSQSRVDTGTRSAVRFGAQGGVDEGIRLTLLQAVTPTLDLSPSRWDVYIIRAVVDPSATAFVTGTWEFVPLYGLQQTRPLTDINQAQVQAEVLGNLQQDAGSTAAANQSILGVMAFHNVESILGLDVFLRGLNTVRSFAVMRVAPVATALQTNGCSAFPIAVEVGARSLNGPGDFPDFATYEFPDDDDDKPTLGNYLFGGTLPAPESMLAAKQRYLFVVPFNGATAGNTAPTAGRFDFTRWDWANALTMETALADSLAWPGNTGASCANPGAGDPGWEHPVLGCTLDSELHVGDPVRVSIAAVSTVSGNDMKDELTAHIDRSRTLRIMLFDAGDPPPPVGALGLASDQMRKVSRFAIVRPLGFNLTAGEANWILFEFISLDNSCGLQALN
jgi:Flp pilus assembly protein TadG